MEADDVTDKDNPYNNVVEAIYNMIGDSQSDVWHIGTVVSPYPLTIEVAGLVLDRDDFEFNEVLIRRAGEVHAGCDYGDEDFDAGDRLLVLVSGDSQSFVAVCRLHREVL
jgi:hypothetical protein